MAIVITILISAILSAALPFIDDILTSIVPIALHAENYMTAATETNWFNSVYDIFFSFGISVIVLKFLKKGFDTYVGWTDGDADADVCFPTLYNLLADVVTELTDQLLVAIGAGTSMDFGALVTGLTTAGIFTPWP